MSNLRSLLPSPHSLFVFEAAARHLNFKNAAGGNLAKLDQFEQQWRNAFDPTLYQLKTMDPQRASAFTQNLQRSNPTAYQALMQKAATLKQLGGL